MHNERDDNQIKNKVLETIEQGKIKMRPRWYFVIHAVLAGVGGFLLFLVVLYLVSFIFFSLRQSGIWFGPLFGSRGWMVLLRSLPWLLIFISFIFIGLLEIAARRYAFAYKRPLLYSACLLILIVIIAGNFIVPLHKGLFKSAREDHLPFAGPLYKNFAMPPFDEVHQGLIISFTPYGFVIQDMRGITTTVILADQTYVATTTLFHEGDTVVVFGRGMRDRINAYGIQKIQE